MSTEVNRGRIALWVEALRSGEYHQGRGELECLNIDGAAQHCCLGVATRVAMAGGAPIRADECRGNSTRFRSDLEGADHTPTVGHLPIAAAEWFGLPFLSRISTNVMVLRGDLLVTLTDLNDVEKLSFAEIADLIEETYLS